MEYINLILHFDKLLLTAVNQYHNYIYILLFLIIFCETGLVITPFLPGDSLLFIAGGIAATGQMNITLLAIIIILAAFCGDNTNFLIGKLIGEKLFSNPKSKIFRQDILKRTHNYYERHGKTTVIIARFIPLVRTFAPFVAGLGRMTYSSFILFSCFASILWVCIFLGGGYLFGNIPFIKSHLSIIILIIMFISVLPAIKIILDEIKFKGGNDVIKGKS